MIESRSHHDTGLSVLVFTLDEEENLPACLDSLKWCDDVHVVDSFSSDATAQICESRGVPFHQHRFEGFGSQRNWALENLDLKHDWVLILDADERVPEALAGELKQISSSPPRDIGAYRLRRRFYLWGRWLKHSSLYPTWVVRFVHRDKVRFIDRGHAETQKVDGRLGALQGYLIDENLKGLDAWFERHNRYSTKEAAYELRIEDSGAPLDEPRFRDPLARRASLRRIAARLPFRGLIYFFYCYVLRLGFLDGRDGLMLCRMKATYQTMIDIKKYAIGRRNTMRPSGKVRRR